MILNLSWIFFKKYLDIKSSSIISYFSLIFKLFRLLFKIGKTPLYFSTKVTCLAPLERHSKPNEPTPANRSKTIEFSILILNLFEWLIILKIDSFVKSFSGLVCLFLGKLI